MYDSELIQMRDALKEARFSGVRSVRDQNGELIEYKSDSEMAAALKALEAELSCRSSPPVKSIIFNSSKGT
jgi:hypothetical protein